MFEHASYIPVTFAERLALARSSRTHFSEISRNVTTASGCYQLRAPSIAAQFHDDNNRRQSWKLFLFTCYVDKAAIIEQRRN